MQDTCHKLHFPEIIHLCILGNKIKQNSKEAYLFAGMTSFFSLTYEACCYCQIKSNKNTQVKHQRAHGVHLASIVNLLKCIIAPTCKD